MKVLYITGDARGDAFEALPGADSAILRTGEPVFVPDPVSDWRSTVAPAIRISRLGTAIKARNARAYYDAIGAMHLLMPADSKVAPGLPALCLDRAFSPGQWLPLDADAAHVYALTAGRGAIGSEVPAERLESSFSTASLGLDEAIERLSEYMTFRTGDILVFDSGKLDFGPPELDTRIDAAIDGNPSLAIRIK